MSDSVPRRGTTAEPGAGPDVPAPSMVRSTEGVSVAVHELAGKGVPDGTATSTVVVCHANGLCALAYRPLAERLAASLNGHGAGLRCLGVDLRGHGESETPEGLDFAWSGFGDDVEAVLDAIAGGPGSSGAPVHGVGHSLGGAALLMAAARRPEAFASLWMFEPIVPPTGLLPAAGTPNPVADKAERRREEFASAEEAMANFSSKPPLDVMDRDALRGYVEGGFEKTPHGIKLRCRPGWEASIFRKATANGVWELLGSVTVPVLVAVGRNADKELPAAFSKGTVKRLRRGILETHDALGHFGPLEDPSEMAESIAVWTRGAPGRP